VDVVLKQDMFGKDRMVRGKINHSL
jgi:hypothetical protein